MKKIKLLFIFCMTFACVIFFGTCVYAKNGDVIGKIYSTDILAKIDGLNAPSYNIGGRTAVIIEELADRNSTLNYAVYAKYDDNARRLDVQMSSSQGFWGEQYDKIVRGKAGEILGYVYETDIKVYVNGYEIMGMNIGGKTAVAIEDLGFVGGINEQFGYSKYRCKANWDAENRIIALDFIDQNMLFSTYDYGTNLAYHINDNVISADFDRMNDCYSFIEDETLSDTFLNEPNVLKPLYFDDGNEKTEIGFMYVEKGSEEDYIYPYGMHYITKPELLKEKTSKMFDGKTPTAEEAFKTLDDKVNYETLDKLETEDFYVLTVKCLKIEAKNGDIAYVAVKKTGGYSKIYVGSTLYNESTVTKTGENIVVIGLAPYADPHGKPATLNCEFNLNNYTIK